MIPKFPHASNDKMVLSKKNLKEIYKSLAYVMMLEYLPERLIAMQLHPTNLHDPTPCPSLHPLHAKVRIGEYLKVRLLLLDGSPRR